MQRKLLFIVTMFLMLLSISLPTVAHPGKTDANGGHWNRKTGTYHYHNGGGSSKSSSSSSSYRTPKPVYASRVNVSNMPSNINAGESIKLNGYVSPSNAEDKEVFWESSDTSIATIDSDGNLTAVGVGKVIISAKTSRGTTSKFNLTVKEVFAERISIEGKFEEIIIGETAFLSVKFTPENTTYKNVEWISDDESIVTVDENGKLTALALGTTTITAKNNELTDSFGLEVKPILAESIEIRCINNETEEEIREFRFEEGQEIELDAIVLPETTTDASVKWSVSDSSIATIEQDGKLTMVSEGTVMVKAETSNGLTDEIEVEVYKSSIIVNVIAGFIVFLLFAGVIGGPIFLVIWLIRKFRKR